MKEQIQNLQTPAAGDSTQSQKTAHARKEGILFLATLWAKLL